jgi:hypothetical protein
MRKGYLAIFLVLMMAIGVASSAQAYDNMAEPSAALVIPFVVANTSTEIINGYLPGDDTAMAIANLPNASQTVIDWSFFDDITSAHLRDKKITVTAGEIYGFLWSDDTNGKGPSFNGEVGYLVFAFPGLDSSSLVANAFFVDASISFAAFIPTLQLVPGVDIFNVANCGACVIPEIREPGARIWSSPRTAVNGILQGDIIFPRFTDTTLVSNNGTILTTQSLMAFWKPLDEDVDENTIQYDTITEAQTSCVITIPDELDVFGPFDSDVVTGEDILAEGAYLITGWPVDGGISWTFIFGIKGTTIEVVQTSLTPHWPGGAM